MVARKAAKTLENVTVGTTGTPQSKKTGLGRGYASSEHWFPFGHGAGRPKGSRNKLSERFLSTLCADFEVHGEEVVRTLRETQPAVYVRVIASLLPEKVEVDASFVSTIADDEIVRLVAGIDRWLAAHPEDGPGVELLPSLSEAEDVS